MGKAAIINPYLDTMGGGERYTLSFAQVLLEIGYKVDIQWKNFGIKNDLEKRFGMNLSGVNFVEDAKKGDGYELAFWVSDGSIPLLHARKNILHFQVPFHGIDGKALLNRMKMYRINEIICNSNFTKKAIDKEFGINSVVVYPPVEISKILPKRKENIILFVGRFSELLQNKNQDLLIDVFKEMNLAGWKLVLAGGAEVGSDKYLEKLKQKSNGLDIEILTGLNFKDLKDLYGKAKIFWSASGFGVDENNCPEKLEHFGITVVEAMAGGVVPVIYKGGGHKEIVENGINGFLWSSTNELIEFTNELIGKKSILKELSMESIKRSKNFDYGKFRDSIKEIL